MEVPEYCFFRNFLWCDNAAIDEPVDCNRFWGKKKRKQQNLGMEEPSGTGVSAEAKSDVIKRMSNAEIGALLSDENLPTAERLSWAFKIHLRLCENVDPDALECSVDLLAEDELVKPLLALAHVPHSLNYIAWRTIFLFTGTTKGVTSLARVGIISAAMRTLRRPQDVQCLRFCIGIAC